MTQKVRIYNEEVRASSINGVGKTGQIHAKKSKIGPLPYKTPKNNSKWIKD